MNCEPYFNPPPPDLQLLKGQIHIWSASLDQPELQFQRLYQTLSLDEDDRAKRFVFERDRRHFAICRGILRAIVARYLSVSADSVSFKYGTNGKPGLVDSSGNETFFFNLSHSEGLALYAFTRDQEVGVDLECMRDISELEQLAERIFSVREIEIFRSLAEGRKKEAFFNGWTRKEAFVKALGDGLSLPLDNFDVSFVLGEPAKLISIEDNSNEISGWSIQDLLPAHNYVAAFAVKSRVFETKSWRWDVSCI